MRSAAIDLVLGDARGLDRLARGDLGRLDGLVARDLERAALPARRWMRCAAIAFSWAMRADFDRLRRGDLGLVDRLVAGDGQRADLLLLARCGRIRPVPSARCDLAAGRCGRARSPARRCFSSEAMRSALTIAGAGRSAAFRSPRRPRSRPPRSHAACARSRGCAFLLAGDPRSVLTAASCRMRAFSVASRAAISASSMRPGALDLPLRGSRARRRCARSLIACSLAIRAFSTFSRAAISASSTVRVRSISCWRMSRSEAMRASLMARSLEMRDFSISSRAGSAPARPRCRAARARAPPRRAARRGESRCRAAVRAGPSRSRARYRAPGARPRGCGCGS